MTAQDLQASAGRLQPEYAPREYLSISTLLSFVRCPRLYFYRKCGLVPPEMYNGPLYGQAMHKAVPMSVSEGLDKAMEAFESVWDVSLDDDLRNLKRARAQLSHYIHSHSKGRSLFTFQPPPEGSIVLDEKTSPYEIPAAIDVGLPIPIIVRMDGWVKHRDTGELWGWEFKTARRINSQLFDGLEMSPQILTYTLVLRTVSKQKIRGIISEAMLMDKVKVDNMTHPIPVQDHYLDSIVTWLRFWGEMLLACEKRFLETGDVEKSFPKNFAGCNAYSMFYTPSFPCDYSNLCRVADWKSMAPMFEVKPDYKFVNLTTKGVEV